MFVALYITAHFAWKLINENKTKFFKKISMHVCVYSHSPPV